MIEEVQASGGRRPYLGNPEREAALVSGQDRRLVQIRTVDALVQGRSAARASYRLKTGWADSLVLTPRRGAYTVTDLLALAPRTFVRERNGAYLLSGNIFIRPGATLSLASPGAFVLRLASDANGFSSPGQRRWPAGDHRQRARAGAGHQLGPRQGPSGPAHQ